MRTKLFFKPSSNLYWDTSICDRQADREVFILFELTEPNDALVLVHNIAKGGAMLVRRDRLTTVEERVAHIAAVNTKGEIRTITDLSELTKDEVSATIYECNYE